MLCCFEFDQFDQELHEKVISFNSFFDQLANKMNHCVTSISMLQTDAIAATVCTVRILSTLQILKRIDDDNC